LAILSAIIPDFYELGTARNDFIDLFIDTKLSFEEIDKFKDLTNKIYSFPSMLASKPEHKAFLALLKKYVTSKISNKYTNNEPITEISTDLLKIDTGTTEPSKYTGNDPVLKAYLENLTKVMKYYLNEW
jgi:hypothetical protein